MTLSRRNFNRFALTFLLGTTLGSILLRSRRVKARNSLPSGSLSPTVDTHVRNFLTTLTPQVELLVPTYLGNDRRRFYGRGTPAGLNLVDRFYLGSGKSYVGGGYKIWSGAGWTGQPTIVRDGKKTYLTIGAYDHHLRKLELDTHREVWRYKFDDILKGSSTVYIDPTAKEENRIVVLQGSRRGINNTLNTPKPVPSFRAISFRTGEELWRLNVRKTHSYSRDNDSSAIDLGNGIIFNASENGIGYFINSSVATAKVDRGIVQPQVLAEVPLYSTADIRRNGGNLVTESSPSRLGDRVYVAAGSGHIYGIDIATKTIVWDVLVGGDLNGSIAISKDGKLFCAIEKQYIPGYGGILKLDPTRSPRDCIEWFLPVGNRNFKGWNGGVVGSAALNDEYRDEDIPALFATNAIDGNLYIGSQHQLSEKTAKDPFLKQSHPIPTIAFKAQIGTSISTPIFTDGNRLISAGYNGVHLFQLNFEPTRSPTPDTLVNSNGDRYRLIVERVAHFKPGVSFESTPVVWDGIVRICSRDGWMYALG
jgi:outer membrane protein assembly factor BamB